MLRASQGVGIGVGGTILILLLAIGIYFWVRRRQRRAEEQNVIAANKNVRGNALELGTREGNIHEMQTVNNTHEIAAPRQIHEIGRSRTEKGVAGATDEMHELEGDVAWEEIQGDRVGMGFVMPH
jgi:hypothetical protein